MRLIALALWIKSFLFLAPGTSWLPLCSWKYPVWGSQSCCNACGPPKSPRSFTPQICAVGIDIVDPCICCACMHVQSNGEYPDKKTAHLKGSSSAFGVLWASDPPLLEPKCLKRSALARVAPCEKPITPSKGPSFWIKSSKSSRALWNELQSSGLKYPK